MTEPVWETGLWRDTKLVPESLAATLEDRAGLEQVADLLTRAGTRRVVVSGSGASYYVALATWLASLQTAGPLAEIVPVPAGLLARDAFQWHDGDVLLALSSSGEARDLIEATESKRLPRPFATITADPSGSISRRAGATAVTTVIQQAAITHTQAFCAAVAASLGIVAIASSRRGAQPGPWRSARHLPAVGRPDAAVGGRRLRHHHDTAGGGGVRDRAGLGRSTRGCSVAEGGGAHTV